MKTIRITEGAMFLVPQPSGSAAVGVVARGSDRHGVLFGYFFKPQFHDLSTLHTLTPHQSILRCRFGDLRLRDSSWPIVGSIEHWNRSMWPMPLFYNEATSRPGHFVYYQYDNSDPSVMVAKLILDEPIPSIRDTVCGSDYVSIALQHLHTDHA